MPDSAIAIDPLDRRLLDCLQRDNQQSVDTLGSRIGLSASAVARRIRRLRADRLIEADVAVVSDSVLTNGSGQALRAILQIKLERHTLPLVEAFRRKLKSSPAVQACLEVTGNFDILLITVFQSMDDFNTFTDTVLGGDPIVQRYETSFVKKRLKMSLALPLDPSAMLDE